MTVAELIKKLRTFDQTLEVVIEEEGCPMDAEPKLKFVGPESFFNSTEEYDVVTDVKKDERFRQVVSL